MRGLSAGQWEDNDLLDYLVTSTASEDTGNVIAEATSRKSLEA